MVDATSICYRGVSQNAMDACEKKPTFAICALNGRKWQFPHTSLNPQSQDNGRREIRVQNAWQKDTFLTTAYRVLPGLYIKRGKGIYGQNLPVPEHIALCLDMGIPPQTLSPCTARFQRI